MPRKKLIGSPAITPNQDEGAPYPGRIPTIVPPGTGRQHNCVLSRMRRDGVPLTREDYIFMAYGATVTPWGAELESELPVEIQDWIGTEWPWEHEAEDEDE